MSWSPISRSRLALYVVGAFGFASLAPSLGRAHPAAAADKAAGRAVEKPGVFAGCRRDDRARLDCGTVRVEVVEYGTKLDAALNGVVDHIRASSMSGSFSRESVTLGTETGSIDTQKVKARAKDGVETIVFVAGKALPGGSRIGLCSIPAGTNMSGTCARRLEVTLAGGVDAFDLLVGAAANAGDWKLAGKPLAAPAGCAITENSPTRFELSCPRSKARLQVTRLASPLDLTAMTSAPEEGSRWSPQPPVETTSPAPPAAAAAPPVPAAPAVVVTPPAAVRSEATCTIGGVAAPCLVFLDPPQAQAKGNAPRKVIVAPRIEEGAALLVVCRAPAGKALPSPCGALLQVSAAR